MIHETLTQAAEFLIRKGLNHNDFTVTYSPTGGFRVFILDCASDPVGNEIREWLSKNEITLSFVHTKPFTIGLKPFVVPDPGGDKFIEFENGSAIVCGTPPNHEHNTEGTILVLSDGRRVPNAPSNHFKYKDEIVGASVYCTICGKAAIDDLMNF